MRNKAPTALVILDGFGYRAQDSYNGIAQAHTPTLNWLMGNYPVTLLKASGTSVGLPEGWIGNSEVGHLTIGCGKAIAQSASIIGDAIEKGTFFTHPTLLKNLQTLKEHNRTLHLIGLVSDAGVHAHSDHMIAFLKAARAQGLSDIVIHAITDGRDTTPRSAIQFLEKITDALNLYGGGILGSIMGRFYGMDRNRNWNLTAQAYNCLTQQQKTIPESWQSHLKTSYEHTISDEFIVPTQLHHNAIIKPHDGVIFCNYRPDRARQLTACFTQTPSPLKKPTLPLSFFMTPVSYGEHFKTTALFEKSQVPRTLSQILHDKKYSIFYVAETEKYAHITYFFNGGREEAFPAEKRVLVPSLTPKEFVTHPRMSADTITEVIVDSLRYDMYDFYVINYANADMVGHTGNFKATVSAVECLDEQLKILHKEIVEEREGTLYITSDHGKAEEMFDTTTKQPKTSHTANPVPFIVAKKSLYQKDTELPLSELADIAPFIIKNFKIV